MEPVEGQRTVVGKPRQVGDSVEPTAVAGSAQSAAPGPIEAEEKAFGEPAVYTCLPRVVIGGAAELVQRDVAKTGIGSQEVSVIGLRARVGRRWKRSPNAFSAVLI